MPQMLPLVPSVPNYRFGTSLDGTQYTIDVRWNARDSAWYLDLLDEEAEPIRMGLKLNLGRVIGLREASADFPDGYFQVSDLSGDGAEAGFDDMGERVQVYFYAADEL